MLRQWSSLLETGCVLLLIRCQQYLTKFSLLFNRNASLFNSYLTRVLLITPTWSHCCISTVITIMYAAQFDKYAVITSFGLFAFSSVLACIHSGSVLYKLSFVTFSSFFFSVVFVLFIIVTLYGKKEMNAPTKQWTVSFVPDSKEDNKNPCVC